VSPEWELGALRVLMKPHDWTRGAIAHRRPAQRWPAGVGSAVRESRRLVRERLDFDVAIHLPEAGDFFLAAEVPEARLDEALGLTLVLSRRLPGLWLTLGRLFIRDGRFYRRERGFKFNLVETKNIRLSRETRAALQDVL
jgi:hypothetical protein